MRSSSSFIILTITLCDENVLIFSNELHSNDSKVLIAALPTKETLTAVNLEDCLHLPEAYQEIS